MKRSFVLIVLMLTSALIFSINGPCAGSAGSAESSDKGMNINPMGDLSSISGKVVESMDSGGYTYVNIEKDGKNTWVAIPTSKVLVGQDLSFFPGAVMMNFRSKTLDRTFENIIFSRGIMGQQGMGSSAGSAGQEKATPSKDMTIKVEKASGPDAYTVAELYEKSAGLDGKTVVFRGKVVKFSPKIMGMNWIHIQDGSGETSKGSNDITVTSQDVISQGDVVTVKGKLHTNKDFGSGYKFAVIVEEASLKGEALPDTVFKKDSTVKK
jgi:hypothetical protein